MYSFCLSDVDVRRNFGDCAVFACRSHIQKKIAIQVAIGRKRAEKELYSPCRSMDGRLRKILLRTYW